MMKGIFTMIQNKILCFILTFFTFISGLPSYSFCLDSKDGKWYPSIFMDKTLPIDTNRLLIKFKNNDNSSSSINNISKKLKNCKMQHYNKLSRTATVELSDSEELKSAIRLLENDTSIEYIQPDYKLYISSIQDPHFNKQWGLSNSGQNINGILGLSGFDINVTGIWDTLGISSNILVGVLDTGIDIYHEDLKDSIYKNTLELSNTYDDDKNGYIDDYCGWDFINSDNSVYDGAEDAHGTHIAGIIAAGANSIGIRGIAKGVKIVPLKFMNDMAGYTSDLIEAIEYAKKLGIKIINCSFSDTHYNYALEQAMKNSDILFVCSAGNEKSNMPSYPSSYRLPNIISVGAVNNQGNMAPFSNYGQLVDVAAPGVDIYSTLPENSYGFASGTSTAAPFVSGIAALLLSYNPNLSARDLSTIIKNTVNTKFTSLHSYIATKGIVDARNALEYAKYYIPSASPTGMEPSAATSTPTPSPTPTTQTGVWTAKSELYCTNSILSCVSLDSIIYAIDNAGNIYSYDTGTDKWVKKGTLNPNTVDLNQKLNLVALNNKIYIIAGNSRKVYEYDPSNGKITEKAPVLSDRAGCAALAYDNKIYVSGGEDPLSAKTFEVYNPLNDSWTQLPAMQYGKSSHCMAASGNKLYSFGGAENSSIVEEYDINQRKWTTLSNAPTAINSLASAVLDNKIYVSGKSMDMGIDLWEYDISKYNWTKKEVLTVVKDDIWLFNIKNKLYIAGKSQKENYTAIAEYTFGTAPSATPTPSSALSTPTGINEGSKTISGKVILKDTAFNKDISIEIFAEQETGKSYTTSITLKKDTLYQNYSIIIPREELSKNYRIGYYINSEDVNLPRTGYYTPDGCTFDVNIASTLSPKDKDINGIDLNLLKKRTISGTISLPDGIKAPAGGAVVYLELGFPDDAYKNSPYKPDYIYNKKVVIPENQTYAQFDFTVIENNNKYKYVLGCETNTEGCLMSSFYNMTGTVSKKSNAGFIDTSSSDRYNIDFKIPGTKYISGMLSLPDGITAPKGGLYVLVSAKGTNQGSAQFINQFVIPEGSRSMKYFVNIPDNSLSSFYVSYQVDEKGYVKNGYYSSTNTTPYEKNASKVYLGAQNNSNVNLTIIKGKTVSGKVSLPESITAPKEGIDVEVCANVFYGPDALLNIQNNNEADLKISSNVVITENSNSADYIITVPQDGFFYIDYIVEEKDLVAHGYYSGSKTSTVYYERKSTLSPSSQDLKYFDFELLKGFKVSCSVSLPSGLTAADDIPLLIEFFTINYQQQSFEVAFSKQIVISRNSSKADLELYLPAGKYYLSYYNPKYSKNGYLEYGFYSSSGSKKDFDFNSQLSVGPNIQSKAVMTLIVNSNSAGPNDSPVTLPSTGGPIVPVPSIKPGSSSTVPSSTATPAATPKPIVTKKPDSADFSDISNHWAKESIISLLSKGIIEGYPDKTIRPDKEITRAEIAKLIAVMLNLEPSKNTDIKYSDKAKIPSWALGYIVVLTDKGILQGYNDNTFRASNYVTRMEMAVIIMRALGYENTPSGPVSFKDANSIPAWSINYVGKGVELGIFNGYTDSTFKPERYITRAEVFKIIDNCFRLQKATWL